MYWYKMKFIILFAEDISLMHSWGRLAKLGFEGVFARNFLRQKVQSFHIFALQVQGRMYVAIERHLNIAMSEQLAKRLDLKIVDVDASCGKGVSKRVKGSAFNLKILKALLEAILHYAGLDDSLIFRAHHVGGGLPSFLKVIHVLQEKGRKGDNACRGFRFRGTDHDLTAEP